jgi:ABC-type multidrug transport system permease subunit
MEYQQQGNQQNIQYQPQQNMQYQTQGNQYPQQNMQYQQNAPYQPQGNVQYHQPFSGVAKDKTPGVFGVTFTTSCIIIGSILLFCLNIYFIINLTIAQGRAGSFNSTLSFNTSTPIVLVPSWIVSYSIFAYVVIFFLVAIGLIS